MLNEDRNRIRDMCDQMDRSLQRLRRSENGAASSGRSRPSQAASEEDAIVVEALVALGILRSVARKLVSGTVGSPEERVAQALRKA